MKRNIFARRDGHDSDARARRANQVGLEREFCLSERADFAATYLDVIAKLHQAIQYSETPRRFPRPSRGGLAVDYLYRRCRQAKGSQYATR